MLGCAREWVSDLLGRGRWWAHSSDAQHGRARFFGAVASELVMSVEKRNHSIGFGARGTNPIAPNLALRSWPQSAIEPNAANAR